MAGPRASSAQQAKRTSFSSARHSSQVASSSTTSSASSAVLPRRSAAASSSSSRPWLSPITPKSPSSSSSSSSAPSLSPFDSAPRTHKTPAQSKPVQRRNLTHTNSPPSSVPGTVHRSCASSAVMGKRARKPSAKAREALLLSDASSTGERDGLASAVGVRKRAFGATKGKEKENEQEIADDDSPCLPRRKRARNEPSTSSAAAQRASSSPAFWIEVPLRSSTAFPQLSPPVVPAPATADAAAAGAPTAAAAEPKKGAMAAPLSTVPLRKQQSDQNLLQQLQRSATRATTPPGQLARNRSPPPPPTSVMRLANFDSSSRERRIREGKYLVRTASGFVPTPTGSSRIIDTTGSASSSSSTHAADDAKRPSPIKFISPAQLSAILRDPSSSSSRTSSKDAASYLSKMAADASDTSGGSDGRQCWRDALQSITNASPKNAAAAAGLRPAFQALVKGKGKARAIEPHSPKPSPLGPNSQPRSSPTNPLGADVAPRFPAWADEDKIKQLSDTEFFEFCKFEWGASFVTRKGWTVDEWMRPHAEKRKIAQGHRVRLELIWSKEKQKAAQAEAGRSHPHSSPLPGPSEASTSSAASLAPASKSSPIKPSTSTAAGDNESSSDEDDWPLKKKRKIQPITDQERLDFMSGYYGHKFATRAGWSEERYLALRTPNREKARSDRKEIETFINKGTAEPMPTVSRPAAERRQYYEQKLGANFISSYGWKADGNEVFGRPPRARKASSPILKPRWRRPWQEEYYAEIEAAGAAAAAAERKRMEQKLKMSQSRELPASSFYAQNKREETSPSPPSRRIVSEKLDVLRPGMLKDQDEDAEGDTDEDEENEEDELMDESASGSEDEEEGEDDEDEEEEVDEDDEASDDGDLQLRRRRYRTYSQQQRSKYELDPPLPRRWHRASARAGPPRTPPHQIKAGRKQKF
ncbi:hypothetical protein OC844_003115 [Tilletia horrida]|nr:hypothetical protein OC844_003115 [Tilletia horrida]